MKQLNELNPTVYIRWQRLNPMEYFKPQNDTDKGIHIIYKDQCHYVTELVGEDWQSKWSAICPVFISTQTGTGKNYFVQHVLVPTVMRYNRLHPERIKRVLILSNRVALNRQNKQELVKIIDQYRARTEPCYRKKVEELTEKGNDHFLSFGNIDVCSYHQLLTSGFLKKEYAYVIVDEAHFFTQDSLFNYQTTLILEAIVQNFQKAVRIYMSATLDDVFLPIIELESQMRPSSNESSNESSYDGCLDYLNKKIYHRAIIYDMPRDYSYIRQVHTVASLQALRPIIEKSTGKWLIFVTSKEEGEELVKELNKSNISAAFICSETRDGKRGNKSAYDSIVENQTFKENVLISTAVIDNGVTIKNTDIQHVGIFNFHYVGFIQMLGRLRIAKGQSIDLYIQNFSIREVQNILQRSICDLVIRKNFDALSSNGRIVFLNKISREKNVQKRSGFGYDGTQGAMYSLLSKTYLTNFILLLKGILLKMGEKPQVQLMGDDEDRRNMVLRDMEDQMDWSPNLLSYELYRSYVALTDTEDESFFRPVTIPNDPIHPGHPDFHISNDEILYYIEGKLQLYSEALTYTRIMAFHKYRYYNDCVINANSAEEYQGYLAKAIYWQHQFNHFPLSDIKDPVIEQQLFWIGKDMSALSCCDQGDIHSANSITKDIVIKTFKKYAVHTEKEQLEKLNVDAYNHILFQQGFRGVDDPKLLHLQEYMGAVDDSSRSIGKVNEFLKERDIPYFFRSVGIRGDKAVDGEGKSVKKNTTFWLICDALDSDQEENSKT